MCINKLFSYGAALLLAALLLGGCGGGDSAPVPQVFPRDIQYKNLAGQVDGLISSPSLRISQLFTTNCAFGKDWCLSSLTLLTSKEQLQTFVAQSPGIEDSKPAILAAGSAIDFSKEQLLAFKLGYVNPAEVVLRIQEMATAIEIQPIVCNNAVLEISIPILTDVFVVVPRDLPAKPVVFLDSSAVLYGPACPFAELVRKS